MSKNEDKEIEELILRGREERNLEYKASMDWKENATQMKVVKACLAFSNTRDGGALVFGMKELSDESYEIEGMSENHFNSFNQDDVQTIVHQYADPNVHLTVYKKLIDIEGIFKSFVVIQVTPFSDIPVVCRKNGSEVKRGEIYTRPYHKNESVPVPGETEMREILDVAIDSGIKKFHERLQRAGLSVNSAAEISKKKFDDELGGL